jgi:hypothetical protein
LDEDRQRITDPLIGLVLSCEGAKASKGYRVTLRCCDGTTRSVNAVHLNGLAHIVGELAVISWTANKLILNNSEFPLVNHDSQIIEARTQIRTHRAGVTKPKNGLDSKSSSTRILSPPPEAPRTERVPTLTHLHEKLINRERDLLGDVEIVYDRVYWPISVENRTTTSIHEERSKVLRFIQAGFSSVSALKERITGVTALDEHLAWLIANGWLEQRVDAGGSAWLYPLMEGPVYEQNALVKLTYDGVSGTVVDLPDGELLLQANELQSSQPIVAGSKWINEHRENVSYADCLIMLIYSGANRSRSVRVYQGLQEVQDLQEILYDLAMVGSDMLSATLLAEKLAVVKVSLPQSPGQNQPATRQMVNRIEPNGLDSPPHRPALASSRASSHSDRVITGIQAHERQLKEAFECAVHEVLIVTPFVRARIGTTEFRENVTRALRRGVLVTIIYGMPTQGDQFDDSEYENNRIVGLKRSVGELAHNVRFIKVTAGEHSKVLFCDDRWAVVGSFNWLSVQNTNETSLREDDPETVRRLKEKWLPYLRL